MLECSPSHSNLGWLVAWPFCSPWLLDWQTNNRGSNCDISWMKSRRTATGMAANAESHHGWIPNTSSWVHGYDVFFLADGVIKTATRVFVILQQEACQRALNDQSLKSSLFRIADDHSSTCPWVPIWRTLTQTIFFVICLLQCLSNYPSEHAYSIKV